VIEEWRVISTLLSFSGARAVQISFVIPNAILISFGRRMSVMMATTTVTISDYRNYNTNLFVVLQKYCSNAILSIIKACLQVPVELKNPKLYASFGVNGTKPNVV
jgi:hypothetical protein